MDIIVTEASSSLNHLIGKCLLLWGKMTYPLSWIVFN